MCGGGDIEGVDIAHGPRMEGVSVVYVDCVADLNMHHCDQHYCHIVRFNRFLVLHVQMAEDQARGSELRSLAFRIRECPGSHCDKAIWMSQSE